MKTNLLTNFSVDRENNRINIQREFAAPVSSVWAAWTQSEILDQWWAPKPWKARTKTMDFSVGGYWLYAMVGPEGQEHFARTDYNSISEKKEFSGLDSFCDPEGNINKDLPQDAWEVMFNDQNGSTLVDISLSFDTRSDLEKLLEMGFEEGMLSAMKNLDEILQPVHSKTEI